MTITPDDPMEPEKMDVDGELEIIDGPISVSPTPRLPLKSVTSTGVSGKVTVSAGQANK